MGRKRGEGGGYFFSRGFLLGMCVAVVVGGGGGVGIFNYI